MKSEDFKDKIFIISEIKNGNRRDIKLQLYKEICTVYVFSCNIKDYISIVQIEGLGNILVVSNDILRKADKNTMNVIVWQAILNSQPNYMDKATSDRMLASICGREVTINVLRYLYEYNGINIDENRIHRIENMQNIKKISAHDMCELVILSRLLKSIV